MSLINNIVQKAFKLTGEGKYFAPYFWSTSISSYNFSGYALNEFIINGYRNPYVFMCIDKIADVASELPFKVIDSAGNEVDSSVITPILSNPNNQEKTYSDFYYKIMSFLLLTGNCFVYGEKSVGFSDFTALTLWNPNCVTINTVDGSDSGAVKSYTYSNNARIQTVGPENILHIKFPNIVIETNWGLSPLYAGLSVYESSNNIFEAEAHLHKNRGISGILSNADSNMPMLPKEQQQLQDDMNKRTAGASNFGKMFITTANLKWLEVGMSPEELKSLEGNLAKLRAICSLYGLDSSLFNDPDNKTYANRAEAEKSMYTSVIKPLTNKINQSLSGFLSNDLVIKSDFSDVSILNKPNFDLSQKIIAEVQAGILPKSEATRILYPDLDIIDIEAFNANIPDETIQEQDANSLAQANLRGSVGGVQGILQVQQSFNDGITSESSAINILIQIYGFDNQTARQILGV